MPFKDPEKGRAHNAAWRAANRERLRAKAAVYNNLPENKARLHSYQKEWFGTPSIRMTVLAKAAITRAKERSMAYDDGLVEHLKAAPPTHCDCCERELDYGAKRGRVDASPSLDRFNNEDGYTIQNVRIVCWRCNRLKRDATIEEMETVVAYMLGQGTA